MNRFSYFGKGLLVIASLALVSCSKTGPKKGAYDDEGKERIAILSGATFLKADKAIASLSIRLPKAYRNLNWAQPGGSASHAVHHLEVADTLSRVWKTSIGPGSTKYQRIISGPVAADGKVFAVDVHGSVSAIDLETGRRLWHKEIELEGEKSNVGYGGGVAYADGKVFATSGFGITVALDANSGSELWRYSTNVPMRGAPTVADGRVFVLTQDNVQTALNAKTGELVWDQVGITETAGMLGAASPAYADGTIVYALSSGELVAMRAENGRVLWQDSLTSSRRLTPLSTLADVDGNPVIDRGKTYALSHAGSMVSIDMRSGERSWEADVAGVNTPWIAGNFAYLATIDSQIICISLSDGRLRWVAQLQRFQDQEKRRGLVKWNGPVLAGDRLFVTSSHGYMLTISPYTGEVLSGIKIEGGSSTPPAIVDGTLIVLSNNGDLIAYR